MSVINILVRRKKAASPVARIVCGNSGYKISFNFDEEWAVHDIKTARFCWNGKYEDVVFTGSVCDVPVLTNTDLVAVGVYAGDLRTTTPALIPCDKSILCAEGLPADPAPDVYAQIMELMNEGYVSAAGIKAALGYTPANSTHTHTATQVGAFSTSGNLNMGNADPIMYPTAASKATRLRVYSGQNAAFDGGAGLILTNKNSSGGDAGNFTLTAHDGSKSATFTGKPNGDLTWRGNDLLHTGNKPSGSYTGNGSAATRTINTGGMGNAILVGVSNSFAIVTPFGALIKYGTTVEAVNNSVAKFVNGVLTLATNHGALNAPGTYTYWVL